VGTNNDRLSARGHSDEILGKRLWELRIARNLSQVALAEDMTKRGFPWHQMTVYRIEDGRQAIRFGEALALAEIFGVELNSLLPPGEIAP
jgi:transcriptional regulator with XRE-family HTH domain